MAETERKVAATNRKARFNYAVDSTLETGIVLTGTEVKSLRDGGASIVDAHAEPRDGELWLYNLHIPEYRGGNRLNHEPKRPRKLLAKKREIEKLIGAVTREGMTLVPLEIYFNPRGLVKVALGLAKGKTKGDKRDTIKARDWKRDQGRMLRSR